MLCLRNGCRYVVLCSRKKLRVGTRVYRPECMKRPLQISRRSFSRILAGAPVWLSPGVWAQRASEPEPLPEAQPFYAATRRLLQALQAIGSPLQSDTMSRLNALLAATPNDTGIQQVVALLDAAALLQVTLNPEMRVTALRGAATAELLQSGWRTFLVRVNNHAGTTAHLGIRSPQGAPAGRRSSLAVEGVHDFTNGAVDAAEARERWIAVDTYDAPPMLPSLSGLSLEYRILQIYSRDAGQREATLIADPGWGEQDLAYRSSVPVLFNCLPAKTVSLHIVDEQGRPSIAAITVRDTQGRVYPPMQKRELPDLNFQPQVYRYSGESLLLPPGKFSIHFDRGPEYVRQTQTCHVDRPGSSTLSLTLRRWFDPKREGYYSGDTHIHAAGCSHYESPTEGVVPAIMERQVDGEALDVGSVLNWGPGFRYQEQFFSGHAEPMHHVGAVAPPHSAAPTAHEDAARIAAQQTSDVLQRFPDAARSDTTTSLVRYDVEVSGFPSSHCGHLVLLQLHNDAYPGAAGLEDWPSWNLPILRWAKSQGAFAGYAHSAHGLVVDSTALPNYRMPAFNSMGANEFIADVTHPGMVDFISGCDLWPFAELNIWYHTLNCGFHTAFAGETDFPCITDERVGGGRSYVALARPATGDDGYAAWLNGLVYGDSYFGDGRGHLLHFRVNGQPRSRNDIALSGPASVHVTATVCARLEPAITPEILAIQHASPYSKPYWHLERARLGETRQVPVEVVLNGEVVHTLHVVADGEQHAVAAHIPIKRSSWMALRIPNAAHTNPINMLVAGKPVRSSRRSAQWCRTAVDVCWQQKVRRIRPDEVKDASLAFDHARRTFEARYMECDEAGR